MGAGVILHSVIPPQQIQDLALRFVDTVPGRAAKEWCDHDQHAN